MRGNSGLWHDRDFLKLWLGHTISAVGSQVSMVALPLVAALVLGATPVEMGILSAMETLPFVLVGLPAGVWVDRLPRRPILIAADIGRGVLLLAIPIAAYAGALRIELLYVLGLAVGVASVFFDIAHQSYMPGLLSRAQLIDGNSKLELSRSMAQLVGPGLGGLLVRVASAPFAMAVDALSFLVSAVMLGLIRQREQPGGPATQPRQPRQPQKIGLAIREGLRIVVGHPVLRAAAACSATGNFFDSMVSAILILFITRELGISAIWLGIILAAGSGGALLAATVVRPVTAWLGLGRTLIIANLGIALGTLLVPAVRDSSPLSVALLGISQALVALGGVMFNINSRSLRQSVAPQQVLGRVNASVRVLVWSTMPVGAMAGGLLAHELGMRGALILAGVGSLAAPLWIVASPVAAMRELP